MKLCKHEKLLSVRVGPQSSRLSTVINKWCEKLTNIRSLSIPKCKFKHLPKSIGKLTHLQYLDISFSDINELPESFCSLYNLFYLNMEGCHSFMFFPEEFKRLVNLRFVYLPVQKLILVGHIENVARKIDCKDMWFKVSTHGKIENLKFMDNLRGSLTIENLELVLSKQAAEEANLNNKQLIDRLSLWWFWNNDPAGGQSAGFAHRDEEVLQGLCPHPNLKELCITYYGGTNLSRSGWLGPNNLPKLQTLIIKHCPELVSIAVESFGQFLSLEELTICYCPKLSCPNAMVLPPSIKSLKLGSCGNLVQSIPSFLQGLVFLEKLEISNCPSLVSFPAEVTCNLKSLRMLDIKDCAALESLSGMRFLVSLKELKIGNCPRLISIQPDTASKLTSLSSLTVRDCAKLESMGGLLYRTSLRSICIENCPNLQETSGQDLSRFSPLEMLAPAGLPSSSSGGNI